MLKNRLKKDNEKGIRREDVIERSLSYLSKYKGLNTKMVDASPSIDEIIQDIEKDEI